MTATKWQTVEQKEKVLKDLIRFVKSDFNENVFTKSLYQNLSNMFSHIAHYNKTGFYEVWFANRGKQLEWFDYVGARRFYGDPEYTRVDIEIAFIDWLKSDEGRQIYKKIQRESIEIIENAEKSELARLKVKYESA